MPGYLELCYATCTEIDDLFFVTTLARHEAYGCRHLLAILLALDTIDIDLCDFRMGGEQVLHLFRRYILPASDYDLLDTAGDPYIALVVDRGLITRAQPPWTSLELNHHIACRLLVVVVALHHVIASNAELSGGIGWKEFERQRVYDP